MSFRKLTLESDGIIPAYNAYQTLFPRWYVSTRLSLSFVLVVNLTKSRNSSECRERSDPLRQANGRGAGRDSYTLAFVWPSVKLNIRQVSDVRGFPSTGSARLRSNPGTELEQIT
ncbi:hypothetical protein KEM48_013446 [Puccinia striiformis f. sp. tritici PST-130]|nr:hypothetical protein KEM48_013446 [Puccinia striiformis f. sp. tritici PST-130]